MQDKNQPNAPLPHAASPPPNQSASLETGDSNSRAMPGEQAETVLTSPLVKETPGWRQIQEKLQRTAHRLQILHKVDQAILAAQSPQEIAETALAHFRQLVTCQRASIILFDFEARETVTLAIHTNGKTKFGKGTRLPLAAFGGNLNLLRQGKIHLENDVTNLPEPSANIQALKTEGMRAFLAVPLITQGCLVGTLIMGANSPNAFMPDDVEISWEVANSLAVALQHAQLWESLQQSEQRYRAIVEDQHEIISRFLPDGTLTFVNEAYCRYVGKTRADLIGQNLLSFVPPEDREKEKRHLAALDRRAPVKVYEHKIVAPDGKIRWLQWANQAILDEAGRFVEFQAMGRDITDHKKTAQALYASEEKYRTVVNTMAEGVVLQAADGTVLASNPSAERIMGLSFEEMLSYQASDGLRWRVICEDGSPFLRRDYPINITLRTGKPCSNVVMGIYHPDGNLIWISVNSMPMFKANEPKPYAVVISFTEITAQKQAEEKLKQTIADLDQQKTILESVLNSIGDGVVVADDKGKFVIFNPAAERMMGLGATNTTPEEWSSRYGVFRPDSVTPLPSNEVPLAAAIRGESLDLFETFVRNPHAPAGFYASNTARPLIDRDGNIIGGVVAFSDITERKLAETKIKTSLHEKELLLRELHHRVKNNMQIISSLLKLQSDYVKNKRYVELFLESQNRISAMALTHEMLYKSDDLTNINFDDYIRDLAAELFAAYELYPGRVTLKLDVKTISLEINKAIPCGLIINELITNALKHAFSDGRQGEIKVAMRPKLAGEVELIVSDNGVGLPNNIDPQKSQSLGLQLVTNLAQIQLDGQIAFDNTAGTTVKIVFRK